MFDDSDIQHMLDNLDSFSADELAEIDQLAGELEGRKSNKAAYNDLIEFCKLIQPDYIVGKHHRILAQMLMAIERGEKDRICVNIPPRHGKSQLVSIFFPAWFLGRNPNKKVMMVSHTTDLAVDFGRKVRNLIAQEDYRSVFPMTSLAKDSKSAGRWNTSIGGEYYACGIGSALAGRGADLLLVDDPHSEQDVINGNFEVFDKAYEWFTFGARTRLMPNGAVAIIQCMTGDTPVLMGDGTYSRLDTIQVGDQVATFDDGVLTSEKVLASRSNGYDDVFAIRTTCGTVVKANERHPFLVEHDNGELQWVRLKYLRSGQRIVTKKDNGESGRALSALTKSVINPQSVEVTATPTTRNGLGLRDTALRLLTRLTSVRDTLSTGMASQSRCMMSFLRSRAGAAQCVSYPRTSALPPNIGNSGCALTTATTVKRSEDCSATTATYYSNEEPLPKFSKPLCDTSDFTTQTIESIIPVGREEVYDLQVNRTENFIAIIIISHNTRWHMDDLSGRVIADMAKNARADQYEVVEFPAILDTVSPKTGAAVQKPLWPEFFDLEALLRTKASMPAFQWNAQYQQSPTAEEASIIKREWWQTWTADKPPPCEYIIMSLDAAAETHNRADYTALTTWGVFMNEDTHAYNIILLNSIKKRVEFPELKKLGMQEYEEWDPDSFIVEKKSAGTALYQEMRRMGLPISEFTPHRGSGDKMARLNAVADIVASGLVWVPTTRWAEEVVEEIAGFPFMSHDDLADSTVMALMRFRQGGFIRLPSDEPEEEMYFRQRRSGFY